MVLGIGDAWFVRNRRRIRAWEGSEGRPSGRGAALGDRNADALKSFDHFISRFRSEILDLEKILVAEAHQIRNGIDLSTLQAVVSANRKVQFFQRDLCLSGRFGFDAGFFHEGDGRQGLKQFNQLS